MIHTQAQRIATGAALAAALFLAGCKADLTVPVKLTELEAPAATHMAQLAVDVPSCIDSDTKMESTSLLEAKQKVGFLFTGAQYEKCDRDDFDNRALFTVPITVGTVPTGTPTKDACGEESVCIERVVHPDQTIAMFGLVGSKFIQKYEQLNRGSSSSKMDTSIKISLTNDTDKGLVLGRTSVFVATESGWVPLHLQGPIVAVKKTVTFKLSDVMTASLMQGGTFIAYLRDQQEEAKK